MRPGNESRLQFGAALRFSNPHRTEINVERGCAMFTEQWRSKLKNSIFRDAFSPVSARRISVPRAKISGNFVNPLAG